METVSHATAARSTAYEQIPLIRETLRRTGSYSATARMTGYPEITIRELLPPAARAVPEIVVKPAPIPPVPPTPLTIKEIIMLCCVEEGLSYQEIIGDGRTNRIAHPRQRFMWVVRKAKPGMSLPEIGRRFGGRDHTTVLHAIRKVESRMLASPIETAKVNALLAALDSMAAPRDAAARLDAMISRLAARMAVLRARRAALGLSVLKAA